MMVANIALQALQVCSLLTALASASSEYSRTTLYHDQIVVKCELTERLNDILLNEEFVDPWGVDEDGRLQVRLGVQLWSELQYTLTECSVIIDNVEEYVVKAEKEMFGQTSGVDAEAEMVDDSFKGQAEAAWFKEYHQYEDIVEWYQSLSRNYSSIARFVESIGKSHEGRAIPAMHITTTGSHSQKPTFYMQCLIHAREWITGSVCMYIANYLCENYESDERVMNLLHELKFVIVPIVNPDGYKYTWTNDRLWRKNRRVNSGSTCLGVDLNRNYNDHWNQGGSSGSACSDIYHGRTANSEPETRATQSHFMAQHAVIAAIDWHSWGQEIMRPYGWTHDHSADEAQLKAIGDEMSTETLTVKGSVYTSQHVSDLYIASGNSVDWFYGDNATRGNDGHRAAAYGIELRDTGAYAFQLPADQIIPTAEEVTPAFLYFAETILDNPIVTK